MYNCVHLSNRNGTNVYMKMRKDEQRAFKRNKHRKLRCKNVVYIFLRITS